MQWHGSFLAKFQKLYTIKSNSPFSLVSDINIQNKNKLQQGVRIEKKNSTHINKRLGQDRLTLLSFKIFSSSKQDMWWEQVSCIILGFFFRYTIFTKINSTPTK